MRTVRILDYLLLFLHNIVSSPFRLFTKTFLEKKSRILSRIRDRLNKLYRESESESEAQLTESESGQFDHRQILHKIKAELTLRYFVSELPRGAWTSLAAA